MAGLIPSEVREALAATLKAAGLVRDVGVHAYAPGDDPDVVPDYPAILIGWANPAEYRLTFGAKGIASMPVEVEIRTSAADSESAERALDDLLAAGTGAQSSIWDALDADPTLGAAVQVSTIEMTEPPRPNVSTNGTRYWSAKFVVTVKNARSA